MIEKKIISNKEHFENIEKAIKDVYTCVASTMGAAGNNVFIEREYMQPLITKDGATVVEHFISNNDTSPIINLLRNTTKKVANETGDGTSTTTALIYGFYNSYNKYLNEIEDKNIRTIDIIREIKNIIENVKGYLINKSTKITSVEELKNIVNISTNGDNDLTSLIIQALDIKDNKGKCSKQKIENTKNREILVSISKTGKEYLDIINGSVYDCGYASSLFTNDNSKTFLEYNNPYILVSSDKIYSMSQIAQVLGLAKSDNKPIVIIAPEFHNDVISTLAVNKLKGVVDVAILNAPGVGGTNTDSYLEDIAVLSGGKLIKQGTPFNFDNINEQMIGKMITYLKSTETKTTLITKQTSSIINKHIELLEKSLSTNSDNIIVTDTLKKRISKLKNGVSIINICSNSDVETFERKDRLDDAIGSLKSALELGYLPGAGLSLIYAIKEYIKNNTSKDICNNIASNILIEALVYPAHTILKNGNINVSYIEKETPYGMGIDVISGKEVNLIDEGIIDPTKVVIKALEHSLSLFTTIATSKTSLLLKHRNDI